MNVNLGAILSVLVASQLLFLSLYLFTNKKGNRRNNRILALVFLMVACNMVDFALRISGLLFPVSSLHLLDDCFFLLYGPAIYFYTQGVVYADFTFKPGDALHAIPFIGMVSLLIYLIFTVEPGVQHDFADNMGRGELPAWVSLSSLPIYGHILIYLHLSWRTLKSYRAVLKDNYSSIDAINLDWLSFMIRTFLGITLLGMINGFVPVFNNLMFVYASVAALLLISLYFTNLVLVKALNQPAIFSGIRLAETAKYAQSSLNADEVERYKGLLAELMQAERLYEEADLKSTDLAQRLGISTKTLSQIINQGFNRNFFDFVNMYRCEEVKRILQGPDHKVTILEAMYASGFNSKSSFNKEFKKLTGQTPSEFKKSLRRP